MYLIRNAGYDKEKKEILQEYPAHLHINILPEYQHSGTGALLVEALENYLKNKGIRGLHLHTSNHNIKALPFYKKRGYSIISREKDRLWSEVDDYESIVFVKKLTD
jgi:ribosomal protein S18 acetylase RimI-like enzyme